MNTSVLNSEKVLLAREILGISDIGVLHEVKRRLAGIFEAAVTPKSDRTDRVLRAVSGKWRDSRSADAMVDEIYSSRTGKRADDLTEILNS